jgi:hypothetical protein
LYIEIYWSEVEAIKKYYWRVFNEKKSPINIISPNCFQLNHMKNGNKDSSSSHQRLILRVEKPVEVPI